MTDADARELLKAARTAQAETGPGTLADYPVPGRDAHLLIHYAPGSCAYRFKLAAPGKIRGTARHQPGTGGAREPARPGPPPGGRETPDGGGRRRRRARPEQQAPPGRRRSRSLSGTTWPSSQGRHTAMLDGYQPGDPMVAVFAYQADRRAAAEDIADEAFAVFNDHPRDAAGASWPAPTTGAGCGRCRSPE